LKATVESVARQCLEKEAAFHAILAKSYQQIDRILDEISALAKPSNLHIELYGMVNPT